jgi:hypothetical protein
LITHHLPLLLLLLLLQGDSTWAPIMGTAYYSSLSQCSKGEYQGAGVQEDDLAIIASLLGYAPSSNGNTLANATVLVPTVSAGTASATATGIVEQAGPVEMFKLQAEAAGPLSFSVSVLTAWTGSNGVVYPRSDLDAAVKVFNAAGAEVTTTQNNAGLAVTGTAALPSAGAYYIAVSGSASGDPSATGYSTYGSLGQFSLTATYPAAVVFKPIQVVKVQSLYAAYDKKKKQYYCSFTLKAVNAANGQALSAVLVSGSWQSGTGATLSSFSSYTSGSSSTLGQVTFSLWVAASAGSCTAKISNATLAGYSLATDPASLTMTTRLA